MRITPILVLVSLWGCFHLSQSLALGGNRFPVTSSSSSTSSSSASYSSSASKEAGWASTLKHLHMIRRSTPRQLCGFRLVQTMNMICNGNNPVFNNTIISRRSDPSMNNLNGELLQDLREPGSNSIDFDRVSEASNSDTDPDRWGPITGSSPRSTSQHRVSGSDRGQSDHHHHHQRVRRSIITECCKNPCTMKQIGKYCRPRFHHT